jgi:hypothetical protein
MHRIDHCNDLPRDVIRFERSGGALAPTGVELAAGVLEAMVRADSFRGVASVRHMVTALDDRRQPRATPLGSAQRRVGQVGR